MRTRAVACLLAVAGLLWATVPVRSGGLAAFILFAAALCVAMSGLRLLIGWLPLPDDVFLASPAMRSWLRLNDLLRIPPWEDFAVVAIIGLEVVHPARPWHTALLGVLVTGYLLVAHLAESGASPRVLRPQVRTLALGACLLAVAAFAATPGPVPGTGGSLLRVLAAFATIATAVLILPDRT